MLTFSGLFDEEVQITSAFRLAKNKSFVSALLSTGLLCSIASSPAAPYLLHHFEPFSLFWLFFITKQLLSLLLSSQANFGLISS